MWGKYWLNGSENIFIRVFFCNQFAIIFRPKMSVKTSKLGSVGLESILHPWFLEKKTEETSHTYNDINSVFDSNLPLSHNNNIGVIFHLI